MSRIEASLRTPVRRFRSLLPLVPCPVGRTPENGQAREPGNDLLQKLQLFSAYFRGKFRQSCNVSARLRKACDKPVPNRIGIVRHDNWNRRCCFLRDPSCFPPAVTMTSTLRRTSSAASSGRPSSFPSAYRHSMTMFFPSKYPSSRRPCRNASMTARITRRQSHRVRYSNAWIFFGCCAWADTQSAKNMAQRAKDGNFFSSCLLR